MEFIDYFVAFGLSFALNLVFVKFWKFDFLRSPHKQDRWKPRNVPVSGGVSIFFFFSIFFFLKIGKFPEDIKIIVAFMGGICIFVLGLIDDIIDLKSYQKFLVEICVILLLMEAGIRTSLFGRPWGFIITFFWILGITNAFNLLDNMDGLSAGIGVIAFVFLGINFISEGIVLLSYLSFIFAALLLGFLIFNFNPARIYLGDSGALTIGYFLSVFTVLGSQRGGKSVLVTIIFPIMIMLIPILDTGMVSITRNIRGQSPFAGGKDHLSHRLVMLGMSEKQAVMFLYLISILLGFSALFFKELSTVFSLVFYFFISLIILLFTVYIGKIIILTKTKEKKNFVILSSRFLYKKKILHILVDLILVALVYYFAYIIRFEGNISQTNRKLFFDSLPIIIFFKILFVFFFGGYKIESPNFSISDGLKILKGVSLGSFSAILFLTFLNRFKGYSRGVFVIDWMLAIMVLGGVKIFYRIFEELFSPFKYKKRNTIIIIGDNRIFQSIDRYLRCRPSFNLNILKNIPLTDFNFDDMMGNLKESKLKVSIVVVENKSILNKNEKGNLKRMNITVFNEREFFNEILKEDRRKKRDNKR